MSHLIGQVCFLISGVRKEDRTDEESRPDVAGPSDAVAELVSGQRPAIQWCCRGV